MNKIFIGLATLLIASPAVAHPRTPRTTWTYSYPEKDVMVRRDWKRCKKIKYVTKYDNYGWFTERKVTPLRSCWKNHAHSDVKLKVIIKD
jgi:hypothetical protein